MVAFCISIHTHTRILLKDMHKGVHLVEAQFEKEMCGRVSSS